MQLLAEVFDVVVGHLGGVDVVLDGIVLRGQAEGVIPDGEQDVIALHPLFPADDVHGGERPGVAHVEPLAGGIGELDEAEELLPRLVPGDGGEGLLLQPLALPLLLNAGKIVLHMLLLIPVNGFLCFNMRRDKNDPWPEYGQGRKKATRYHPVFAARCRMALCGPKGLGR